MFFLYNSHPFYILSSEIDLRKNPHLRLLQFRLSLQDESQGHEIRWFNSICESVTSKSLVVDVREFIEEVEICDKIQDTLLALYERIETFSVYLPPRTKRKGLFSKLYEARIVVKEYIEFGKDKRVGCCILVSYLPYSSVLFLASSSFPPISYYSTPKCLAIPKQMYV